jgi:hypothetical protein
MLFIVITTNTHKYSNYYYINNNSEKRKKLVVMIMMLLGICLLPKMLQIHCNSNDINFDVFEKSVVKYFLDYDEYE